MRVLATGDSGTENSIVVVCHLGVEVQAHDAAGGVAQELGVGGVLQGEHADHASLGLLVEIICGHAVKGTLLSGH